MGCRLLFLLSSKLFWGLGKNIDSASNISIFWRNFNELWLRLWLKQFEYNQLRVKSQKCIVYRKFLWSNLSKLFTIAEETIVILRIVTIVTSYLNFLHLIRFNLDLLIYWFIQEWVCSFCSKNVWFVDGDRELFRPGFSLRFRKRIFWNVVSIYMIYNQFPSFRKLIYRFWFSKLRLWSNKNRNRKLWLSK